MENLKNSKSSKQRIIYFKLIVGLASILPNNILKGQVDNIISLTKDPIIHVRLSALKTLILLYQKLKVITNINCLNFSKLTENPI